jgi:hypothetical protein
MDLLNFYFNWPNITLNLNLILFLIILFLILYNLKIKEYLNNFDLFNGNTQMEISEENLGIGSNTIKFKPNNKDKEIAYKLWIELSTRKLGIPLDEENDLIYEVYDSWYEFFKITRLTLKEFPVSKLQNNKSNEIIDITIRLLNGGLRRHLTKWQAKYRHWYVHELENSDPNISPQDIQKKFPEYNELIEDLKNVNNELIYYVDILQEIIFGER